MALTTGAKVFLGILTAAGGTALWQRQAKAAKRKKGRPSGPQLETDVLSVHVWKEPGQAPQVFELDVGLEYEIPLPMELTDAQVLYSSATTTDQEVAPTNWGSEAIEGPQGPTNLGSVFMSTHKPGTVVVTFTARGDEGATFDWQRMATFRIR